MTSPRPVCGAFGSRVCPPSMLVVCCSASDADVCLLGGAGRHGFEGFGIATIPNMVPGYHTIEIDYYQARGCEPHACHSWPLQGAECSHTCHAESSQCLLIGLAVCLTKAALRRDRQAWSIAGSQLSLCDISH